MRQISLFDVTLADGWYAGVDEAGRGPLAGPVVAAAVVLDHARPIAGANDSKKLSERQRESLSTQIITQAHAYAIAEASVAEIDEINILQASLLAMRRAVTQLLDQGVSLDRIHVDGNRCPAQLSMTCHPIVGGDGSDAAIACASILAKVTRDRLMRDYDATYPDYEFAKHKGYPTARHRLLLEQLGPSPIHRLSFGPVRRALEMAAE
ncbi:MAG TPA: ribonuclease HII [Halothiobacillus sp.]|nr:ribonuclease HII [Halothiobacillus sp.]